VLILIELWDISLLHGYHISYRVLHGEPWSSLIVSYNITSINHNQHTNIHHYNNIIIIIIIIKLQVLCERYPDMTAIELDQRAVAFLGKKLPTLKVLHQDVLTVDWAALAEEKEGRISIIANLPYYIVSQVLFSLADSHRAIDKAVVTMQVRCLQR